MYKSGLDLAVIGCFRDHDGFDGTMLGTVGEHYHFEFTSCRTHPVQPTPTNEDLLVFYLPGAEAWQKRGMSLLTAGFREVPSFNPYWARNGRTFEDRDCYRLVIQQAAWTSGQAS